MDHYCLYLCSVQHISATLSLVVVLAFWYFIRFPINALSIHEHGISAALNVIDVLLCANPMPFRCTVYKPLAVAILYVAFSIVLEFCFNITVYKVLDWRDHPGAGALDAILCLVLLVAVHGMLCGAKRVILRGHARNEPESPGNQSSKEKGTESITQTANGQGEERMDIEFGSDKQIYGEMSDVPDDQGSVQSHPAVELQPMSL